MIPELRLLLRIQTLFFFAYALGGIFLQVFLFTLGGFSAVALFNLITAGTSVVVYGASGFFLSRFCSKDILLAGLAAYAALFFTLFAFQDTSVSVLPILAMLNGIGGGMLWAALNLSHYLLIPADERHGYFGRQSFWMNTVQFVAPFLGGAMLLFFGLAVKTPVAYSLLFVIIAVMMAAVYWEATYLPRHSGVRFSVFDFKKHRRSWPWKLALAQDVGYGFFDFAFGAFSAVLIFLIAGNEFLLGLANSAGAAVAAIAGLIAGFLLRVKKKAYIAGMFFAPLGIFLFAWGQNVWGVLALILIYQSAMPFLTIATSKTMFDLIDYSSEPWQEKYHLFVEREAALGIGRIISLTLLYLLFTGQHQYEIARGWMVILAGIPFLVGVLHYGIVREKVITWKQTWIHISGPVMRGRK